MLRLATLDVAGTTVQITDRVPTALGEALRSHGVPVSQEAIRAVRGISKRESIARLIGDRVGDSEAQPLVESVLLGFRESLLASYETSPVSPVAGTLATLVKLREHGLSIWLTTGFDRRMANLVVDQAGLRQGIDGVVSDDDVVSGRPAPDLIHFAMKRAGVTDPDSVLAAGDTVADLAAAAAAGVGFVVGVLSGAHDRATLSAVPHDSLIDSVADLPAELLRLGLV